MDNLVVGEEPGKGGEGSHHPLEGDHCLFHVAVQKEDRSSRETVRKNFHSMLNFFNLHELKLTIRPLLLLVLR